MPMGGAVAACPWAEGVAVAEWRVLLPAVVVEWPGPPTGGGGMGGGMRMGGMGKITATRAK